jgi:hypothetical protein
MALVNRHAAPLESCEDIGNRSRSGFGTFGMSFSGGGNREINPLPPEGSVPINALLFQVNY